MFLRTISEIVGSNIFPLFSGEKGPHPFCFWWEEFYLYLLSFNLQLKRRYTYKKTPRMSSPLSFSYTCITKTILFRDYVILPGYTFLWFLLMAEEFFYCSTWEREKTLNMWPYRFTVCDSSSLFLFEHEQRGIYMLYHKSVVNNYDGDMRVKKKFMWWREVDSREITQSPVRWIHFLLIVFCFSLFGDKYLKLKKFRSEKSLLSNSIIVL